MVRKSRREQLPEERSEGLFDVAEEIESLDEITAGLPGMEDSAAEAPAAAGDAAEEEDSGFQTPEEVRARFMAGKPEGGKRGRRKKNAGEEGEKPKRSFFGRRKSQSRLVDLEAEDPDEPQPDMFRKRHPRLRMVLLSAVTAVLALIIACTLMSRMIVTFDPNTSLDKPLSIPQRVVVAVVTPIQRVFSSAVDAVTGLFDRLALLLRIEEAYNELLAEYEQGIYTQKMAEEYEKRLAQYEDLQTEARAYQAMQPISCRVIGRADGNYFSTFTIDKGTADGVEQYMAVVSRDSLIGYTESVETHSALVRTIIDSEASIAALISSSRDQGTVRGTLGVDGTAMCRMYYLPEDHLPRPGDQVVTSGVGMSFPKGISIGIVRESTRGLSANKQYIVVEPTADFQHIEYVTVLRYKPTPEDAQGRESSSITAADFVPLETGRPYPTFRADSLNVFGVTATPAPVVEETPTPSPSPSPTPYHTIEPYATEEPRGRTENLEFNPAYTEEAPTEVPTSTPSPSPTPFNTLAPEMLTLEEED